MRGFVFVLLCLFLYTTVYMRALYPFLFLIFIIVAGAVLYPASPLYYEEWLISPCTIPLSYTVGDIDQRFSISQEDVIAAAKEAEDIWESSLGENIFVFENSSDSVPIQLVFDDRQRQTHTLHSLLSSIDSAQERYEVAVAEYKRLSSEYETLYQTYSDMRDAFQQHQSSYQEQASAYQQTSQELAQEIAYWNNRGGAPKDEYDSLTIRQDALVKESRTLDNAQQELQDELSKLNTTRDKVTSTLSQVNELVPIINTLAQELEYNVDSYNTIQDSRGEFVTGTYAHQKGLSEITVYQFDSYDDLVLVLAHEMGHALGLDHASGPSSIMYPFIDTQQHALSFDDIALFRTTCSR